MRMGWGMGEDMTTGWREHIFEQKVGWSIVYCIRYEYHEKNTEQKRLCSTASQSSGTAGGYNGGCYPERGSSISRGGGATDIRTSTMAQPTGAPTLNQLLYKDFDFVS